MPDEQLPPDGGQNVDVSMLTSVNYNIDVSTGLSLPLERQKKRKVMAVPFTLPRGY